MVGCGIGVVSVVRPGFVGVLWVGRSCMFNSSNPVPKNVNLSAHPTAQHPPKPPKTYQRDPDLLVPQRVGERLQGLKVLVVPRRAAQEEARLLARLRPALLEREPDAARLVVLPEVLELLALVVRQVGLGPFQGHVLVRACLLRAWWVCCCWWWVGRYIGRRAQRLSLRTTRRTRP